MAAKNAYFDTPSRLAAETRAARAAYRALDRGPHPALTVDRDAAVQRIEAAQAAESTYWAARSC